MLRVILVLAGVAMVLLAAAMGRNGRLSMGHAAAWFWVGLAPLVLVLAATLLRLGEGFLVCGALLWAAGAGIGFGLAQARAQTRLETRLRDLAQEIALLTAQGSGAAGGRAGGGSAARARGESPESEREGRSGAGSREGGGRERSD